MLLENLDTATDIRIQNYKDVTSALISLGAESPNIGRFVPGGVHSRFSRGAYHFTEIAA